jgi:hypothetical protein
MSADSDTHTAATAYGEVEVEVVECSSCGTTVARDTAEPFTIGEDPAVREGWACEHCADDGPAGFPVGGRQFSAKKQAAMAVAFAPLLAMLTAKSEIVGSKEVKIRGRWFLVGVLAVLLWVAFFTIPMFVAGPSGAGPGVPL